ncbi:unnamed protein product [Rhizophagus irregularis]|nr:unnamed protein product [Rhizophagus irregularis]
MTAPQKFQDTIKSPSWCQAGSSNHMPKRSAEIMVKKESTLESLTGNQRGTEWQKLHHKTWDPNNCKQARPST